MRMRALFFAESLVGLEDRFAERGMFPELGDFVADSFLRVDGGWNPVLGCGGRGVRVGEEVVYDEAA